MEDNGTIALVVAVVNAIGTVIVTPLVGLATLYINRKFDSMCEAHEKELEDVKARLAACEARHGAKSEASKGVSDETVS